MLCYVMLHCFTPLYTTPATLLTYTMTLFDATLHNTSHLTYLHRDTVSRHSTQHPPPYLLTP